MTHSEYTEYFTKAVGAPDEQFPGIHKNVFVVDTSWVAYRSYYVFKQFGVVVENKQYNTGVVYGLIRMISSMKKYDPRAVIFLAIDSYPTENRELVKGYKEGRPEGRYDVHEDIAFFIPYLSAIPNVYIIKQEGKEADDVLGSVPFTYCEDRKYMYDRATFHLYTNDMDSYQAIRSNVFVFSKFDRGIPTSEGEFVCVEKWGVPPVSMAMYKAIRGKASDNVQPIVPRFPEELARKIALRFPHPQEMYDLMDKVLESVKDPTKHKYFLILRDKKDEIMKRYQMSAHSLFKVNPYKYNVDIEVMRKFLTFFALRSMKSLLV